MNKDIINDPSQINHPLNNYNMNNPNGVTHQVQVIDDQKSKDQNHSHHDSNGISTGGIIALILFIMIAIIISFSLIKLKVKN